MTNRRGLIFRILTDFIVALSAVGAFVGASHSGNGTWLFVIFGGLLLAAGFAGYLEPAAKRVWIHPLVIMSPEIIVLPVAFLTCHGFECAGFIAFLMVSSLFALVLMVMSYIVFYVRRWIIRSNRA
ncbi:MAG TPA: hypothetical protein VKV95_22990 [Terriglobia bacterium]|nr:hypothetical protein [Terriglobia bacterium]